MSTTKPSEKSLKPINPYEMYKTGTLVRMIGEPYAYPISQRLQMEEELNTRFTIMDRNYHDAIISSRRQDERERRDYRG